MDHRQRDISVLLYVEIVIGVKKKKEKGKKHGGRRERRVGRKGYLKNLI